MTEKRHNQFFNPGLTRVAKMNLKRQSYFVNTTDCSPSKGKKCLEYAKS